jgi:hypothetical protein
MLEQGNAPTRPAFRDLSNLTTWLRWLLILGVVLIGMFMITEILDLLRLQRGTAPAGDESLSMNDLAMAIVGLLSVGVWLATAVVFLRWIYLAKANTGALGATQTRFRPGWSIGWYFIPFANLWKPYQAMKELWCASVDPGSWPGVPVPSLLRLWWTLWIISNLLGQASMRATIRANTVPEEITAALVSVLSSVVDIPLYFVAIALVTRIWQVQAWSYSRQTS